MRSFLALLASLLLTPFQVAVVPPPMSLFQCKFESAINHACFTSDQCTIVVGLSDGSFCLVNTNMDQTDAKPDFENLQIFRCCDIDTSLLFLVPVVVKHTLIDVFALALSIKI